MQQQQQQPTIAELDAQAAAILQRMKDLIDVIDYSPYPLARIIVLNSKPN